MRGSNKLLNAFPKNTGKKTRMEYRCDERIKKILKEYKNEFDIPGSLQKTLTIMIVREYLINKICKLDKMEDSEVIKELKQIRNEIQLVDTLFDMNISDRTRREVRHGLEELERWKSFEVGNKRTK